MEQESRKNSLSNDVQSVDRSVGTGTETFLLNDCATNAKFRRKLRFKHSLFHFSKNHEKLFIFITQTNIFLVLSFQYNFFYIAHLVMSDPIISATALGCACFQPFQVTLYQVVQSNFLFN